MPARKLDRALSYFRRSSPGQENSLEVQLTWAMTTASRLGVRYDASLSNLKYARDHRLQVRGDMFLDDAISGADLERPGFAALRRAALTRTDVSHLLIFKRDRAARPEEAIEMMAIEKELRQAGLTLVFSDRTAGPLERGQADLADDLAMFVDYFQSGDFLRKHAERVILTQRSLAERGFSTGGRPPYGFGRFLVDANGEVREELPPGKHVRQPGCHVQWIPKDEQKIAVWLLILELRERGWGNKRIAGYLDKLGIPSPDAGRIRIDNGVPHVVPGTWNHTTLGYLCRNAAIIGIRRYGRRSEGAHRRIAADGYRPVTSEDRNRAGKPRVIQNDESIVLSRPNGNEPRLDPERWSRIQVQMAERGRSQRGATRATDPAKYPLSLILYDQSDGCGHPMYARSNGGRKIHVCGRYMRTSGAECENNSVDAEAALKFVLETIGQLVHRNGGRKRLRKLLLDRAQGLAKNLPSDKTSEIGALQARVRESARALETAQRRLVDEADDDVYAGLRTEYKRVKIEHERAERLLAQARGEDHRASAEPEQEVDAALALLDNIERITTDLSARREINDLLRRLGVKVGLSFAGGVKGRKRKVRILTSGILAFGGAKLPVPSYGDGYRGSSAAGLGESDRPLVREGDSDVADVSRGSAQLPANCSAGSTSRKSSLEYEQKMKRRREGVSFTKVTRGDWI